MKASWLRILARYNSGLQKIPEDGRMKKILPEEASICVTTELPVYLPPEPQ